MAETKQLIRTRLSNAKAAYNSAKKLVDPAYRAERMLAIKREYDELRRLYVAIKAEELEATYPEVLE